MPFRKVNKIKQNTYWILYVNLLGPCFWWNWKHFSSILIIGVLVSFCCSNNKPLKFQRLNNYFLLSLCEGCALLWLCLVRLGWQNSIVLYWLDRSFRSWAKSIKQPLPGIFSWLGARAQGVGEQRWTVQVP